MADAPEQQPDRHDKDHILLLFVDMVNSSPDDMEMSLGVTLFVSGSVVSGHLVSGRVYFDGIASSLAEAWPWDGSSELKEAVRSWGEVYDDMPRWGGKEDPSLEEPTCIHLKDARIMDSAGHTCPDFPWWRGKIEAVDGFALGIVERSA
jgi:hypothetical protein